MNAWLAQLSTSQRKPFLRRLSCGPSSEIRLFSAVNNWSNQASTQNLLRASQPNKNTQNQFTNKEGWLAAMRASSLGPPDHPFPKEERF